MAKIKGTATTLLNRGRGRPESRLADPPPGDRGEGER